MGHGWATNVELVRRFISDCRLVEIFKVLLLKDYYYPIFESDSVWIQKKVMAGSIFERLVANFHFADNIE